VSRKIATPVALAVACITGAVATVALTGGTAAPAPLPRVRVSTATVRLTNLTTTVLTAGTLGYAPGRAVTNQLTGTYTWLPAAGVTIRPGQVLYRVDDDPVFAMKGRTPAWRTMAPGMSGPDVRQLQANLISLGDAHRLFTTPTGYYDLLTADAVQNWQRTAGLPVTGQVGFGQVSFVPAVVRVRQLSAIPGGAADPGQVPYQVTTTHRIVSVPVNPTMPAVRLGARVSIVLPSLARTPGLVIAVGVSQATTGTGASGHVPAGATSVLTVAPSRPAVTGTASGISVQVAFTVSSVRQVLAVPVSALLALSGGGYGIEVVTPAGAHHLVGVRAGTFAGGLVQVTGEGIAAGTLVVVAQ
jgi:multidrug efflux system membrane fusion protein